MIRRWRNWREISIFLKQNHFSFLAVTPTIKELSPASPCENKRGDTCKHWMRFYKCDGRFSAFFQRNCAKECNFCWFTNSFGWIYISKSKCYSKYWTREFYKLLFVKCRNNNLSYSFFYYQKKKRFLKFKRFITLRAQILAGSENAENF